MSKIKTAIEETIAGLAAITGYAYDYLLDLWNEECTDGDADFDYFVGVTLERDW